MQCPITIASHHTSECEECGGVGRLPVETREGESPRDRKCPECEGEGEVSYITDDHPAGCEVCNGLGTLPKHVEEWVAAEQIAEMPDGVQRAVIRLHNLGMLVRPPATCEYGLIELCVAGTDDVNALLAKVGLEPLRILNTEIEDLSPRTRMGHWIQLVAVPPSDRALREFARRAEESHAAA